jgi:cell division protein FtsL
MLPQSMAHNPAWGHDRWELKHSLASLRPANIALKTSHETRALALWLAAFVMLSVLIGFGHVWLRIRVLEFGYDRSATRSIIQKLELEGQRLTAEVETLESPGRLEKVAIARLEMIRPGPAQQAVLP